jgi:NAD+ diphosphatase
MQGSRARFVVLREEKPLFLHGESPQPVLFTYSEFSELPAGPDSPVFLGTDDDYTYFALDLTGNLTISADTLARFGSFQDLRKLGPLLQHGHGAILAQAKALLHWNRRHRFCGDCGSPTQPADGGYRRVCTNQHCSQQHFPRTDPAIIVLVRSGRQCLLGRQAIWPRGFYSTIAGFVEPGETLEDAVAREILEETGIRVQDVHYYSSQPWPFPCSIMLGFTAWAVNGDIRLFDNELEDARWFSREALRNGLKIGSMRLPSSHSIAFRLIEDWFDEESTEPLMTLAQGRTGL